ncbi:MAG: pyruvate ferredoxin oxidoreductase [Deltaproteobacteria bacterium]|nr:MAG: pyruvate ferredoxin oxidoreductase [Deltaproteobacteria bacterium]
MSRKLIDSGNNAAALAARLAGIDVVAAYPITPQTPLTEKLSDWVASGELDAEYVAVESEHSALGVCIGAAAAGARAFTATSANGLLYMSEQLHWAAGARLPLVMCVVNRGVGAPWSVWNDHQDAMSQRDTGWIQLFCRDHQEIVDTVIKAFRLAEAVHIPVMVNYDGYYLSHTYMPFELPEESEARAFVGPYRYEHALDPDHPENLNSVTLPDPRNDSEGNLRGGYMDIRHNLQQELHRSLDVLEEIDAEFNRTFGRGGAPILDAYRTEDAVVVLVAMGSLAHQLRVVTDRLREEGVAVGVMAVQVYRPFPARQLVEALAGRGQVLVFEKGLSYGHQGALFTDLKSVLYAQPERPKIGGFIVGLGGRVIETETLYQQVREALDEGDDVASRWVGVQL